MEKSSTSITQKIVIWFIIVAMTVGSIGAYFIVIVENENQKREAAQQAKLQKEYEEEQAKEAKKVKEPLDGYAAAPFDKAAVTALSVEVLKQGDGKAAAKNSNVSANYFGWTSDGKIFDSSKKDGVVTPADFPLDKVISGWTEGLTGVKAGSVVKLTIPANKAYGETGAAQAGIGPNEPLAFIVELVSVK